jgi:hypothetical protein
MAGDRVDGDNLQGLTAKRSRGLDLEAKAQPLSRKSGHRTADSVENDPKPTSRDAQILTASSAKMRIPVGR